MNKLSIVTILAALFLTGCGGGSSENTDSPNNTGAVPDASWVLGQFQSAETFANLCENARTGTDPYENQPYPDKSATAQHEKMYLRSFSHETYLWYDQLDDDNPADSASIGAYFDTLKIDSDKFHFFESYDDFKKESQSGVVSGYGVNWTFISNTPPRILRVAFTEENSPAALAGLIRGDTITAIDGTDINSNDTDTLNQGLSPQAGETHTFTVSRTGVAQPITVSMTAGDIQTNPVKNSKIINFSGKKIGYVQFNQFISAGQTPLINAFNTFRSSNINELVLDLRYNRGGLLLMAAQLSYMIAGEQQTQGKDFYKLLHNDKQTNENRATAFEKRKINWATQTYTNETLPSLNLQTVYILSTETTCSASEAIINGLRGADVKVVLIGSKTCGKPYGFNPQPNCGQVYYTVQFKGANNYDFGEYDQGLTPVKETEATDSTIGKTANVPGCIVADDFDNPLGNNNEALLNAALNYIDSNQCPNKSQTKVFTRGQNLRGDFTSDSALSLPQHPLKTGLVDIKINEPDNQ